jgi:hypothetical protein
MRNVLPYTKVLMTNSRNGGGSGSGSGGNSGGDGGEVGGGGKR